MVTGIFIVIRNFNNINTINAGVRRGILCLQRNMLNGENVKEA